MSFWRKISPRGAVSDFVDEWRRPQPYRWQVLGVAVAFTFTLMMLFIPKSGARLAMATGYRERDLGDHQSLTSAPLCLIGTGIALTLALRLTAAVHPPGMLLAIHLLFAITSFGLYLALKTRAIGQSGHQALGYATIVLFALALATGTWMYVLMW